MKKIGNIFFITLTFFMSSLYGEDPIELQLSVKTAQGLPLQEAGIGKPFIVSVTVTGATSTQKVFVDTHNAFELRSMGVTTQINSVKDISTREVTHQYSARAKEAGTFTLGPATVTNNGNLYTSNSVSVTVVENPVERVALRQPKLELIVTEGPIVVGQTVSIALRFYHLGVAQLSSINSSQIPGFNDRSHEGPFKGTAQIDGVPYDYVEWRTHIVTAKEGTFVFQPARAVYTMQARDRMSIWQQLSDRFSFGMQQYETFSSTVQVTINPLPACKGTVDAVGHFTHLEAFVNQTAAKQGEGIVYTLDVTGDIAVHALKHKQLTLPESLTSYESKNHTPKRDQHATGAYRKLFEYIIQAREPGSVTIPAQTFTFYDTQDHRYKQLTSEPITLQILEDAHAQTERQESAVDVKEHDDVNPNKKSMHTFPLYAQGVHEFRTDVGLNPLAFWTVLFLIISGLAVQWARYMWLCYCERNHAYLRSRAAFQRACKRLAKARREGNVREVYNMFIDVCADRQGIAASQVVESVMVAWLKNAHISEEMIKQWQQYSTQLQTYVFYSTSHVPPVELFTQAEKWLAIMEKIA